MQALRATMFRNNIGAYQDDRGRWVRYGVCSPGGSDLIGWTEHVVRAEDIGRRVAVFTAIETKGYRGRASEDQKNFVRRVRECGGIAGIAFSDDQAQAIIEEWKYNEVKA